MVSLYVGGKVADKAHNFIQTLDLWEMSGFGHQFEAGARYAAGVELAVLRIHNAITFTPCDQGRD